MGRSDKYQIFEQLYNSQASNILRFVYLRVSDYEIARDIMMETFFHFWKSMIKNTDIHNPKALLYVIARGLIIDYYRNKKNKKVVSIDKVNEELLSSDVDLTEKLRISEEIEYVHRTIKDIKREYQEVILLHYVEDLSILEIATILHKTQNAVRVTLHRALASLKKKL